MNEFYNTINSKGSELKTNNKKASNQNDVILDFFQRNWDKTFNPFEVEEALGLDNTPTTSIRRAMTTLTDKGSLVKTDIQRLGRYGKLNFCWKLADGQLNLF